MHCPCTFQASQIERPDLPAFVAAIGGVLDGRARQLTSISCFRCRLQGSVGPQAGAADDEAGAARTNAARDGHQGTTTASTPSPSAISTAAPAESDALKLQRVVYEARRSGKPLDAGTLAVALQHEGLTAWVRSTIPQPGTMQPRNSFVVVLLEGELLAACLIASVASVRGLSARH